MPWLRDDDIYSYESACSSEFESMGRNGPISFHGCGGGRNKYSNLDGDFPVCLHKGILSQMAQRDDGDIRVGAQQKPRTARERTQEPLIPRTARERTQGPLMLQETAREETQELTQGLLRF